MKLIVFTIICIQCSVIVAFEVGIRKTVCSLIPEDFNDPCGSLYEAICDGAHCKCPSGTHESKSLKRCQKGQAPKSSSDDLFDLPFDYNPDKNKDTPSTKPKDSSISSPDVKPGPPPPSNTDRNFFPGIRRTICSLDPENFNDPCGSLYEAICDGGHCKCPSGTHESKTLKRCQKGQAPKSSSDDLFDLPFDYNPDKNKDSSSLKPKDPQISSPDVKAGAQAPSSTNRNIYPDQPRPGSYPFQPPDYPQQPSNYPRKPPDYPLQPPGYPQQPSSYPQQPANNYGGGGDPHLAEKTGGGIGGGIGLIVVIAVIYFCCKGEKGKNIMNMLSKFKGGGGRATQPMPGQNGEYGGGGGGGGVGYPMQQIHGQQIYTSPPEQNIDPSIPSLDAGNHDARQPSYGIKQGS